MQLVCSRAYFHLFTRIRLNFLIIFVDVDVQLLRMLIIRLRLFSTTNAACIILHQLLLSHFNFLFYILDVLLTILVHFLNGIELWLERNDGALEAQGVLVVYWEAGWVVVRLLNTINQIVNNLGHALAVNFGRVLRIRKYRLNLDCVHPLSFRCASNFWYLCMHFALCVAVRLLAIITRNIILHEVSRLTNALVECVGQFALLFEYLINKFLALLPAPVSLGQIITGMRSYSRRRCVLLIEHIRCLLLNGSKGLLELH